MSDAHAGMLGSVHEGSKELAGRAADWLYFAAAPTFAAMALLTGVFGGGVADALCSAAGVPSLSGMTPMYVLMSAFHSAPWLKLMAGPRSDAGRP